MNFSKEERTDMIFVLGECQRNYLLAQRVYQQRYPRRRCPRPDAFRRVMDTFITTGSVAYPKPRKPKYVINDENQLQILMATTENPHVSTREISRLLDISQTSIVRTLKSNKFHPYRIHSNIELRDNDIEARQVFCQWATTKINAQANFFNNVLFTDEATFHSNGIVNRRNFHYYSDENPHVTRQIDHQHRWSINVWGGILGDRMIGPHFFEGSINGQAYAQFLTSTFVELLEDVPLTLRRDMWMQQDGAPPHSTLQARNILNEMFPGKWIGRGGPIHWPARSPDITKLDFFYGDT